MRDPGHFQSDPSELRNQVAQLSAEVRELREDVKGLIDAWTTAGGLLKLVKWCSVVGAGLATAFSAVAVALHITGKAP
jgi:hypothetical protein